jgi:hypothetical protein
MSFIQIIDVHTTNYDEIDALDRAWERDTAGRSTVRRNIVTRDHNDPSHYVIMVFFDSYESAMANSALPETSALAEKLGALVDGPTSFLDLDVVDDR